MKKILTTILFSALGYLFTNGVNASEMTLSEVSSINKIAEQCSDTAPENWKYRVYADISGKSGNSEEFGTQIGFRIKKDTADYSAKFYGSHDMAEKDGTKTSDESKLGATYTTYFTEKLGFFLNLDLERDDFEDLDLRATPAAGLSYRVLFEKDHKFTTKFGLGYRYEDFSTGTKNEAISGYVQLDHYWKFADWGEITNEITFTPSFEDTSDFLIEHDSGMDIPLAMSKAWKLRLGVSNTYNNQTAPNIKELDTTYYARLVVDWE